MPTYEYECKSCGYGFEAFQSMSEEPLKDCPKCGKEVRRIIFGGAGVIFKGSGFYVTDKGKSSGKASADPEKKPKTETPSGDSASACANCPANNTSDSSGKCPAKAKTESKTA